MNKDVHAPGLEGVVAAETTVSSPETAMAYCGFSLRDLMEQATFPEVAYLLMHGDLPDHERFADFESIVCESAEVDPAVDGILDSIPLHVSGIEVLRTIVSILGNFDAHPEDGTAESTIGKAMHLLAQLPIVIATRHRTRLALPRKLPCAELSYAGNLFWMLQGFEPSQLQERALDAALILGADLGLQTATFAARVAASAGSDLHGALTAAIGAATADSSDMPSEGILKAIRAASRQDQLEAWLQPQIAAHGLPGFRTSGSDADIGRNELLSPLCEDLACSAGFVEFEQAARRIEQYVVDTFGLVPHFGWTTSRLLHYLGLDCVLFEPIHVLGRIPGWTAHVLEQSAHNCRYRPLARYVGSQKRPFIPFAERG